MFGGHPNEDFLESLQHDSPDLKKVIYLAYKQDDKKVLYHSGLYFHNAPSAKELIDANVIRGGRKVMFLTYEEDYNDQVALDSKTTTEYPWTTKKRTLLDDNDETLPKTKKQRHLEPSGPSPSVNDQQASSSSPPEVTNQQASSSLPPVLVVPAPPPSTNLASTTSPAPNLHSSSSQGERFGRRALTSNELLIQKNRDMKETFPQFVTVFTDRKLRTLYRDVSFSYTFHVLLLLTVAVYFFTVSLFFIFTCGLFFIFNVSLFLFLLSVYF